MPARRFPLPWSVEEYNACFIVRDRDGQALAYVYFEDEPGRRSAAKLPTLGRHCPLEAQKPRRLLTGFGNVRLMTHSGHSRPLSATTRDDAGSRCKRDLSIGAQM